jgi:hypothetical protein
VRTAHHIILQRGRFDQKKSVYVGRALPAILFILQIYQSNEKKPLHPNLTDTTLPAHNGGRWKKANLWDSPPNHASPDYNGYNPGASTNRGRHE